MINFNKYPFFRLLSPFGLGILIALTLDLYNLKLAILLVFTGLMTLFVLQFFINKSFNFRWLIGANIVLLMLTAGMLNVLVNQMATAPKHDKLIESSEGPYIARITDVPVEREATTRVNLELLAILKNDSLLQLNEKVLCYFEKTPKLDSLNYGSIISFSGRLRPVDPPKNPGQFDYREYLSRKGIFYQVYLKQNSWHASSLKNQNPIYSIAYRLRNHLLNVLQTHQLSGDEYAVAAAVLLGYDESLPAYLRKGYVAAGAMHVLCVSGLHVGIVFLIFSFLLKPVKNKGIQGVLKTLFLLLIIWTYALITGLSPSIQRASLMISFVLLGKLFGRKGFALNSVAASAFFLLLINPQNLLNIGFQLSYAAVFGILLLHKPISNLFYFRIKILAIAWDATALALAAQLATTPFVLYYFYQFPLYFWLSNLLLMPLSFLVIVTGMALLLLYYLPLIPLYIGKILSSMIYLMNTGIQFIESLPYAVLKGLYINGFEFALIAMTLVLIILLIKKKRSIFAFSSIVLILLITVSFTNRNFKNRQQLSFVVYDINKQSAVDFILAKDHILLVDSSLKDDSFSKEFFLQGNWVSKGLSTTPAYLFFEQNSYDSDLLTKRKNLISFGGKLILLWDKSLACSDSLSFRPHIDWVLIRGKNKENLQQILNCYEPKMIILDGSVPYYSAEKWKESAIRFDIPIYYTKEEGAYIHNY